MKSKKKIQNHSKLFDKFESQKLTTQEASKVVGGVRRRTELDHLGAYNFMVEISGVSAGITPPTHKIEIVEIESIS